MKEQNQSVLLAPSGNQLQGNLSQHRQNNSNSVQKGSAHNMKFVKPSELSLDFITPNIKGIKGGT